MGGDGLGGGGGRGRAGVGYEVSDREVGFVAEAGDDRHGAGVHGASDDLFIEGPELLDRATAAGEDDDVDAAHAIQLADGLGDADRGLRALDGRGGEDNLGEGPAAGEHVADVVEDGAGGRGGNADGLGAGRQRALAGGFGEAGG